MFNQINILTPFSRKENKDVLIQHLEPFNIQWYPIIHEDIDFGSKDWIHPVKVTLPPFVVDYCYFKLNQFLYTIPIKPKEYYLFLCDDDFYEDDFFMKLRPYLIRDGALPVIVSMKRGIPGSHPTSKHSTTTLIADRANMCIDKIGLEQIILRGDILDRVRFMNWSGADGILAQLIAESPDVIYLPDIYVYFNYLEKGRWQKINKSKS